MTQLDQHITCAVLTVGRSDYSILRPLIEALSAAPDFEVGLWVGGAHFDKAAGRTADAVIADGWPVWGRIELDDFQMTQASTTGAMAAHLNGVNGLLESGPRPSVVIILGDRYEAVSVGLGLVPHNVPIAHISGGSITLGAIDDVFRHCLTKLSNLHFCDTSDFAGRIHRLGEPVETVFAVGALGLDGVARQRKKSFSALAQAFDFPTDFAPGFALATLHPETRSLEDTEKMVTNLLNAFEKSGQQTVFTYPNADPGADIIIAEIEAAAVRSPSIKVVKNFGAEWFYTAMSHAGLVIGNSSSGIIEAASFGLPVVDVGQRQGGRFHGENVLHCDIDEASISTAIEAASSAGMMAACKLMQNPYGDGRATERIIAALRAWGQGSRSPLKSFADYDPTHIFGMAPTS